MGYLCTFQLCLRIKKKKKKQYSENTSMEKSTKSSGLGAN